MLERIEDDLATALRAHDEVAVSVLRLLKSACKNEQIKLGHELSDEESLKIIQREAKQRRDSIDAYEKGGRADLAANERAELDVLKRYLPTLLGEEELGKLVDEAIKETGASDVKQMGAVIAAVMKKSAGAADGAAVSRLVRQRLS